METKYPRGFYSYSQDKILDYSIGSSIGKITCKMKTESVFFFIFQCFFSKKLTWKYVLLCEGSTTGVKFLDHEALALSHFYYYYFMTTIPFSSTGSLSLESHELHFLSHNHYTIQAAKLIFDKVECKVSQNTYFFVLTSQKFFSSILTQKL